MMQVSWFAKHCAARPMAVALVVVAGLGAQDCSPWDSSRGDGPDGRRVMTSAQALRDADQAHSIAGSASYPMSAAPLVWVERQKLFAGEPAADDWFSDSVALSGDTALVGVTGDDDAGSDSGSAYVFVRSALTWAAQQKLLAGDGAANDWFGGRVALSGDTAIVGANGDDDLGSSSGAAYIFVRAATSWTQQGKLVASDGRADHDFGFRVSLSGDTAVVGAIGEDDTGWRAGSAYVFVRAATSWTQQAKLIASDGVANDYFGGSLSVSGDTAIVGAWAGYDQSRSVSGSAYLFERTALAWTERQKLVASDGGVGDFFGSAVSLSGDTAIVASIGDYDAAGKRTGSAYAFVRAAASWTEQDKLVASDGAEFDEFGISVSLSGELAAVGAWTDDNGGGVDAGSAYVFERTATSWTQQDKFVPSDVETDDFVGGSVSLSGDTLLVAASEDDDGGVDAGAAHIVALRSVGGQSCSGDGGCVSKHCADGYCCDSACDGSCEACDAVGLEGTCSPAPRGSAPAPSCSGYLCNGTVGSCPDNCAGDEDCTVVHHCDSTAVCVPKFADGQSCSAGRVCLSGHCVDGTCCAEECADGCGSCVIAGLEGACTPIEKGQPGTPSCAPYLCAGGDSGCPAICAEHSDCASGNHCAEGRCQADGVQGAACSEREACTTGHCTDGVCCLADACGAYRCGPAGACEAACDSSAQCARGYQCSSANKCVPLAKSSGDANDGGSCHLAGVSGSRRSSLPWFGAMALSACLVRRRRGRRAAQRQRLPSSSRPVSSR